MMKCSLARLIKRIALPFALWLAVASPSLLQAEDGVIDLGALPNYAKQPKPSYIFGDNTPPATGPSASANPITNTGATLGRVLFYDKRLSRNDTVSCSSCHHQDHAFGDPASASAGVGGMTPRHAMRLINARFAEPRFFWDDRAPTLENQTTQPFKNAIEMGFSGSNGDPTFADLLAKISALPEYQMLFKAAFGSPGIDESRMQKALAQFIRSIQSFDSKFDEGLALGSSGQTSFSNFSDSEKRGRQLFINSSQGAGANCFFCHNDPTFSNSSPGNNGVITTIAGGTDLTIISSPTLRDLVGPSGQLNGPLMHNGSFTSIAQVIEHYNAIPGDNPNLSLFLKQNGAPQKLNLTDQQKLDLEAFLRTLTGKAVYTDPKWSNPFRADGSITLIDAPPASQAVNLSTRMRVLSGDKVGIGGFIVTGNVPKRVLVRALGPSLAPFGLSNLLSDPTITLNGPAGFAPIVNDNWTSLQRSEIEASGLAPGNELESAIVATLAPGNYTAVLSGTNGTVGTGILEIYDLDFAADSKLGNISTRAFVGTGDDIVIAGFTVGNGTNIDNLIIRGLGPSLQGSLPGQVLADPKLEVRNANGASLAANDNWSQSPDVADISASGLAPLSFSESAVAIAVGPGAYTALLSAASSSFANSTGLALIEVYSRGRLP